MKKLFLIALGLFVWQIGQAQEASFGIKVGLSSSNFDFSTVRNVQGDNDTWSIDAGDTKVGFQAGFMGRIGWDKFIIQPELYFSSVTNEYQLKSGTGITAVTKLADQTLSKLDIPILIGYKPIPLLRINAGPVASVILSEKNGLAGVLLPDTRGEADDDTNTFTFGAQMGIGFDIGKLAIDVRYETALSDLGSGLTVGGQEYSFDSRTDQIMLSLGILF